MSYYSNIVSIVPTDIYSNVTVAEYSNLSVEDQANYLECNYYSSNTVGYYSNLMVYDGINVFSNISSNAYNELTPELRVGTHPSSSTQISRQRIALTTMSMSSHTIRISWFPML